MANGYECGFSTCWPPASPDRAPPDDLFVDVTAGDTILLRSRATLRGPCVSVEEAALAAAACANPTALAERLVENAFSNTDAPYAAVVVLR